MSSNHAAVDADGGPDFLLIGAARSGTTWLAQALAAHPDLAITTPKEPHYLALADRHDVFAAPGDDLVARRVVRNEADWRALFRAERPGIRIGDASVSTIYYPDASIERIAALDGDFPLIAVLRAPWERARSAWTYQTGYGYETLGFDAALAAEAERIRLGYQFIWHYRCQSRYVEQLAPFMARFGERVHVVEYERLVEDPDATIADLHRLLGVEVQAMPDLGRINASPDPRFGWLRRAIDADQIVRPIKRAAQRLPRRVRRSVMGRLDRSAPPDPFPDGFVESFGGECRDLKALLGPAAPRWCDAAELDHEDMGTS